jgi:hypothetical protein
MTSTLRSLTDAVVSDLQKSNDLLPGPQPPPMPALNGSELRQKAIQQVETESGFSGEEKAMLVEVFEGEDVVAKAAAETYLAISSAETRNAWLRRKLRKISYFEPAITYPDV